MPETMLPESPTPRLEQDIEFVEELLRSGGLEPFRKTLTDDSLTDSEILQRIPQPLVRLAFVVARSAEMDTIKRVHPEEIVVRLSAIGDALEHELPELSSHRATRAYVADLARRAKQSARPESLQEIASVNHMNVWIGSPPLFPAARLVLTGPRERLLFDYTTGLDDLFFLMSGVAKVVSELLADALDIHRRGLLTEIPPAFTLATKSIRETLDQIDRHIAELAPPSAPAEEKATESEEPEASAPA